MSFYRMVGLLVLGCLGLSGCGSSSSTPVTASSVIAGVVAKIAANAPAPAPSLLQAASREVTSQRTASSRATANLATIWTTTGTLPDLATNGGTILFVSPEKLMGELVDPNKFDKETVPNAVSGFGKMNNVTSGVCIITGLFPADSSGLPANGSYTVAAGFPATASDTALVTTCNAPSATTSHLSGSTVVVSTPASTTLYDKQIILTQGTGSSAYQNTIFLRTNTATGQMQAAIQAQAVTTPTENTRIYLSYTPTTQVTVFEWYSHQIQTGTTTNFDFQRYFTDQVNNVGYMAEQIYNTQGISGTLNIQYTLAGIPGNQSQNVAVSLNWSGVSTFFGGGAADNTNDNNGCVSTTTGLVVTPSSLACSVTGTPVSGFTAAAATMAAHTTIGSFSAMTATSVAAFTSGATLYSTAETN